MKKGTTTKPAKPAVKTSMREAKGAEDERRGRDAVRATGAEGDLEKGMGTKTTVTGVSSFEMDASPVEKKGWGKFFGKKR
jgi:hypothetical protein